MKKRFSEGDSRSTNLLDVDFFVIVGRPPSGTSDDKVVTNIPVWFTLNFDDSVSWGGSDRKSSPGSGLWNTVHAEVTESATNHLVTIDGERW